METKLHSRFFLAVMLLAAWVTVDANAQSVLPKLGDRDKPSIEIYPKYPVSITTEPGTGIHTANIYTNDLSRAGVVMTVHGISCQAHLPEFDEQRTSATHRLLTINSMLP